MRIINYQHARYHCPTVNIDQVFGLLSAEQQNKYKAEFKQSGGKPARLPIIDVRAGGYFKVLGKGKLDMPFILRTRFVSRVAERKLREIGGAVELAA